MEVDPNEFATSRRDVIGDYHAGYTANCIKHLKLEANFLFFKSKYNKAQCMFKVYMYL